MPIPKPAADETEEQFVARCMGNDTMVSEYPDEEQRSAICYDAFQEGKDCPDCDKRLASLKDKKILTLAADIKTLEDNPEADFEAIITTHSTDREAEAIVPSGIDMTEFEKNPVIAWGHNYNELPIGKALSITRFDDHIVATGKFADKPENWQGPWFPDAVHSLVKQGILKGVSIGYYGTEKRRPTKRDIEIFGDGLKRIISKCKMVEFSMCTIPANKDALVIAAKSMVETGQLTEKLAYSAFGIDSKTLENAEFDEAKLVETLEQKKVNISKPEKHLDSDEKKTIRIIRTIKRMDMKDIKRIVREEIAKKKGKLFLDD